MSPKPAGPSSMASRLWPARQSACPRAAGAVRTRIVLPETKEASSIRSYYTLITIPSRNISVQYCFRNKHFSQQYTGMCRERTVSDYLTLQQ